MADLFNSIGSALGGLYNSLPKLGSEIEQVVVKEIQMIGTPPGTRAFIRLAGLSGATAVALGAYGSHVFRRKEIDPELKYTFDIANNYHFLHTLALLGVPMSSRPVLTGTLMTAGLTLFCGSCYYHAFTDNKAVRRVTPYGGFLLIFAWASMMLQIDSCTKDWKEENAGTLLSQGNETMIRKGIKAATAESQI